MLQREPDRKPSLTPETVVAILGAWLESRSLKASDGLISVFADAGRLAATHDPGRRTVSTRLLLFAAAEIGGRFRSDEVEDRALKAVSRLMTREPERYHKLYRDYFARGEKAAPGQPPALSQNAKRLLALAAASAATRSHAAELITAVDLLRAFPLPGSRAEALLHSLAISREQLRATIDHAVGLPPSPAATQAAAPRARARKPKAFDERVSAHTDQPATADQLGRRSFAQVLALRIKQAKAADEARKAREEAAARRLTRRKGKAGKDAAFIVHLHGPWGSGKSSVLNFLRIALEQESDPSWIVVDFNAWRDQRLQPPWWTLITTIYLAARAKLGWRKALLFLRWQMWRARADYFPIAGVALFAMLILGLLWLGYGRLAPPAAPAGTEASGFDTLLKAVTLVMTSLTIVGAIYLGFRTLALGSRRAAQAYADLKADPYRPIASLFEDLVGAIDRPVAVFIDDLDRCDAAYVVELLEGIQTLMRGAAVTYVVAADRKWICSSFEQRYSGFTGAIGEPGRPLGYLFLDKMFQISAPLPAPSPEARSSYWLGLLKASPEKLEAHETRLLKAERDADAKAAKLSRPEEMQAYVTETEESGDPVELSAVRGAVAKRITSQDALDKLDHRLEAFAALVEPNPRAMKRLVNAYAMQQSTLFLSGSNTIFNTLVRWTILELRWPLLADFLATRPECVDRLRSPLPEKDLPEVPDALRRLFGDPWVVRVLGPKAGSDRLSAAALREILGAVQGDR